MRKASMSEEQAISSGGEEFGLEEYKEDADICTAQENLNLLDLHPNQHMQVSDNKLTLPTLIQQTDAMLDTAHREDSDHSKLYELHPDFAKLTPKNHSVQGNENADVPQALHDAKILLKYCPIQAREWIIYQAKLRPDIPSRVVKDMLTTICMAKGLMVQEEKRESIWFRRKLDRPTSVNGLLALTHENVYVHIGVSATKLRVLRLFYGYSGDGALSNVAIPASLNVTTSSDSLHHDADDLYMSLRAAIIEGEYALTALSTPSFLETKGWVIFNTPV